MKLHNDATTSSLKERYILSSKTNFFMGSHHTTGKQLHYCIGRFSAGTHADTRTSSFAQSCDATHVTNVTNALNNRIVDSFFFRIGSSILSFKHPERGRSHGTLHAFRLRDVLTSPFIRSRH
jgi:hypothetical protein